MKKVIFPGYKMSAFIFISVLRIITREFQRTHLVVKKPLKTMFGFLLLASIPGTNIAHAGEVPGFNKPVMLQAVEQSVPEFIQSLFSQIGVPVRVEAGIPGNVNGAFQGTAKEVFDRISQAFNVYLYYDTSVVYVYPSDEMQSIILPVTHSAAKRVTSSAIEMGLVDGRNYVTPIESGGLMVNGSARFTQQIESLSKASIEQVKSIKPKKSPVEFRLFKLKYAWADDIDLDVGGRSIKVPGVASLLRTLILDDGTLPLASNVAVSRTDSQLARLKGLGLNAGPEEAEIPHKALKRRASDSQFSIVAQPQLNAVAIRDTADRMPLYEQLIESLDVEPEMVEIEATIIDIDVERTRELGINWRLQGSDAEVLFGSGTASDELLQPGQVISPQGQGGVLSLVLGDSTQFFARVKALEAEGAANIVSKPHVLTLSNVEAVLGATTEFFVRVEGNEEVELFNVPVGTVLRVTPHVYNKGANKGIKLLVNIEDGAVQTSSVDNIPLVERSTISTQALINEGSSLLIGGLVRESSSESETSVPGLGKVPLLGNLFRSKQTSKFKRERLFMITPRTANSDPAKRDLKGPTLQGDPMDILSSPKARLPAPEIAAVEEKKNALVTNLREETAPLVIDTPDERLDREMTIALLNIPDMPSNEQLAQGEVLNQWRELVTDEPAAELVAFEEVKTELPPVVNNTVESNNTVERPALIDAPVAFSDEKISVPVENTIAYNSEEELSLFESPTAFSVTQAADDQSVQGTKAAVKDLARGIMLDLKARNSEGALEKILLMKDLDPRHDYALNGESYLALMSK